MPASRKLCGWALLVLCAAFALAQEPNNQVIANQNRTSAGALENGVLTVHLELRKGAWHPEADDGPQLFVDVIGEAGHAAQIPGPLLRMTAGTTVHAFVTNKLKETATVFGLNTRPGDPKAGIDIPAGETRDVTFAAGAAGTYYYWARTSKPFMAGTFSVSQPVYEDAFMNGAFIVDEPGAVVSDRIFVIDTMFVKPDVLQEGFEVVSINGKSYPYTEPLEYNADDNIRWRVINPSTSPHPMHLHGAFFQVLSRGNFDSDKAYGAGDRQSEVTEAMAPAETMMMEWKPAHVGRWLFHCHFQLHMSTDERVPKFSWAVPSVYDPPAPTPVAMHKHDDMGSMKDMAGLVLVINVKGKPAPEKAQKPHKVDLVIAPDAASGKLPTFSCSVRDGKKIVASEDKSVGPPIVLTRGEPAEVTITNHLKEPTTVHWHGLELESYYDGVMGGGAGDQMAPAIPAGGTFVARFTPDRAGTFIYHTHSPNPNQLSGGVYGALIVLEPGQSFDASHDKLLVIGSRDADFNAKHITLNGMEQPGPLMLTAGEKYRLRVIDMAPNLYADFDLGNRDHQPEWKAIAKDGAMLPGPMVKTEAASLRIASGETYDFEFQPGTKGEIPLQIKNVFRGGTLNAKIEVQ